MPPSVLKKRAEALVSVFHDRMHTTVLVQVHVPVVSTSTLRCASLVSQCGCVNMNVALVAG